ncbi:STAS domain-containing protein [Streptomyces sp. TR06-5]|uniref:STAS domain-containing protein n=1 Tax=unclassified Streptomyces TaxID=2593676 RepID=UPI0039A2D273
MSEKSRRLTLTLLVATDGCALLRAAGELDVHTEQRFLADAGELVDSGHLYLVLDLTALTFCDSRGLNCLLALDWLCRRLDGRLILASVGNRLLQLLEQTKVRDRFLVLPSVGAALDTVPPEHRPAWPPIGSGAGPTGGPGSSPGGVPAEGRPPR